MTYDYTAFRGLATRLITKFGMEVELTLKSEGSYDTATSTVTAGATVVETVHAVFKPTGKAKTRATDKLIEFGEWDLVLSAEECTSMPRPGDTILRGTELLIIGDSDEARPGATGVVYFCKLRT
jgi:hypothetical protein